MALVETVALPMKCGLAGDVVALVREPDGRLRCLVSVGPGGGGARRRRSTHGQPGRVPSEFRGAPAGYARLAALGRLGLPALVAPAVEAATDGLPWSEIAVRLTAESEALLRRHNRDTVFLPGGRVPTVGEMLRLSGMADLLRAFGEDGEKLFHGSRGEVLCERVRAAGGFLAPADLEVEPAAWTEPMRLPLAGGAVLAATPAPTHGPALLRAVDLALHRHVDPMAAARAARHAEAEEAGGLPVGGTSLVTAAETGGGAAVVLMHSNSYPHYGSGLVVNEWDLVLNNRPGRGFDTTAAASSTRAPAPGRVPPTTLHAWAYEAKDAVTLGATPGGINQMVWNLQGILDVAHGLPPSEVVKAPRWSLDARDDAAVEEDHAVAGRPDVRRVPPASLRSVQQIVRVETGQVAAAADRRTGGGRGNRREPTDKAMKVQQSFDVEHPAKTVWHALSDLDLVATCMPGAELTGRDGDDYTGRIRVRLGPITARFDGKATVVRDDATYTGTVDGQGTDTGSGSRAAASLSYVVQPTGASASRVSVDSDIKLSGSLAQFGRSGIVNDVARQLTRDFFQEPAGTSEPACFGRDGTRPAVAGDPRVSPARVDPLEQAFDVCSGTFWASARRAQIDEARRRRRN